MPVRPFGSDDCQLFWRVPLFASLRSIVRPLAILAILGSATAANAADGEVTAATLAASAVSAPIPAPGDPQFRSLFNSWRLADGEGGAVASIPSQKPVEALSLSSTFGVRSDPFSGRARRHDGVDIPGPMGTPIYATADGVAEHAGWSNGYGNLVKIDHGAGLETRYGHMSRLAVNEGDHITKGQIIGYMGSTGRSTGSHLHYEVRIDGAAVSPLPFLASSDYMVALNATPRNVQVASLAIAVGGPDEGSGDD